MTNVNKAKAAMVLLPQIKALINDWKQQQIPWTLGQKIQDNSLYSAY